MEAEEAVSTFVSIELVTHYYAFMSKTYGGPKRDTMVPLPPMLLLVGSVAAWHPSNMIYSSTCRLEQSCVANEMESSLVT